MTASPPSQTPAEPGTPPSVAPSAGTSDDGLHQRDPHAGQAAPDPWERRRLWLAWGWAIALGGVTGHHALAGGDDGLPSLAAGLSAGRMLTWAAAIAVAGLGVGLVVPPGRRDFHVAAALCGFLAAGRAFGSAPRIGRIEPLLEDWTGRGVWLAVETAAWAGLLWVGLRAAAAIAAGPWPPDAKPGAGPPDGNDPASTATAREGVAPPVASPPGSPEVQAGRGVPPKPHGPAAGPRIVITGEVPVPETVPLATIAAGAMVVLCLAPVPLQWLSDRRGFAGALMVQVGIALLVAAADLVRRARIGTGPLPPKADPGVGDHPSAASPLMSPPVWTSPSQPVGGPAVMVGRSLGETEVRIAAGFAAMVGVALTAVLLQAETWKGGLFAPWVGWLTAGSLVAGFLPAGTAGVRLVFLPAAAGVVMYLLTAAGLPDREAWPWRAGMLAMPIDWVAAGGAGLLMAGRAGAWQEFWWGMAVRAGDLLDGLAARVMPLMGLDPVLPTRLPAGVVGQGPGKRSGGRGDGRGEPRPTASPAREPAKVPAGNGGEGGTETKSANAPSPSGPATGGGGSGDRRRDKGGKRRRK